LTEYENIIAGSFIFRAESGSIFCNASNPVVFVVHATQKSRNSGQPFDDAMRDHAQLMCMVEFQKIPFLVITDLGEIDE
jgi:hypothetical protein